MARVHPQRSEQVPGRGDIEEAILPCEVGEHDICERRVARGGREQQAFEDPGSADTREIRDVQGVAARPLQVPAAWATFRLPKGDARSEDLRWKLTLDSPLRAQAGELFVSAQDQKRHTWQWRLPFQFELR